LARHLRRPRIQNLSKRPIGRRMMSFIMRRLACFRQAAFRFCDV
jgi:hypothetical protein